MSFIFLIIGLILLIYYAFLAVLGGYVAGVALIWVAGGIFFIVLGIILLLRKKGLRTYRFPLFIKVFLVTSAVILVVALVYTSSLIMHNTYDDTWDTDPEFVLVPGATLHGDGADEVLQGKLTAAADYWRIHQDVVIIVTGGGGSEGHPSEAYVMRQYLLNLGVPLANIVTETRSISTEENVRYGLEIVGDNAEEGVVVITSDYHMFRTIQVAENLTDLTLYAYPVDTPFWERPYNMVYESLALVKSWMNGYIDDSTFLWQ